MPSFFIRLRSELGWRLRIFAAPRGPSMTQPDFSRAARMWFRVLDSRLSSGGVGPALAAVGPPLLESDGVGGSAFAARAAAAANAGMLPGQLGATYFIPTFIVPLLIITHGLAFRILLQHQPEPALQAVALNFPPRRRSLPKASP
jgi:hypothetical protein